MQHRDRFELWGSAKAFRTTYNLVRFSLTTRNGDAMFPDIGLGRSDFRTENAGFARSMLSALVSRLAC